MVSGAEQSPTGRIPEDEGKIAQQVLDTCITPGVIGMQEQLSVTGRVQAAAAAGLKLFDQLRASVQTRIGGYPRLAIEARRLPLAFGLARCAQHRVAQAHCAVAPDLQRVRPAEGHELGHALEQAPIHGRAIQVENAGNAAHCGSVRTRRDAAPNQPWNGAEYWRNSSLAVTATHLCSTPP